MQGIGYAAPVNSSLGPKGGGKNSIYQFKPTRCTKGMS